MATFIARKYNFTNYLYSLFFLIKKKKIIVEETYLPNLKTLKEAKTGRF